MKEEELKEDLYNQRKSKNDNSKTGGSYDFTEQDTRLNSSP